MKSGILRRDFLGVGLAAGGFFAGRGVEAGIVQPNRGTKPRRSPSTCRRHRRKCRGLAADVAGHVADALNATQGQYEPRTEIAEAAAGCLTCHGEKKQAPGEAQIVGRMQCTSCHKDSHKQKK